MSKSGVSADCRTSIRAVVYREDMRWLGVLVVVGAIGCVDVGPLPHVDSTYLAVGATARISSYDGCVGEQRNEFFTYHCADDTVTGLSGSIDAPFTFASEGSAGVVTAHDVGDQTLQLTVHTVSDRDRVFPVPFRGRLIDGMAVATTCSNRQPPPTPLLLATSTTFDIKWSATSGTTPLGTNGLPTPLAGEALTLEARSLYHERVTTSATSGPARLVSPNVPSFAFDVDVVDRANVTIEATRGAQNVTVSSTVNVFVKAMAGTRELCMMPGGGWTTESITPSTCAVVGQTSFVDGERVAFVIYAVAAGTCQVLIHEPTGMLDKTFQMTIAP